MYKSLKKNLGWCVIGLVAVLTMATLVMGCQGPPGERGPAGPTGSAGPPGQAAVVKCSDCHNDTTLVKAIQVQYEASVHRTGGNFERNGADCSVCHNSQGFTERVAKNLLELDGPVSNPAPINCRTCHEIHETYTEADFALRVANPVKIELTGDTINLGKGNLCATCHQARWSTPVPEVGGADINITSSRYGPHHGPQSTILTGIGGYGTFTGSNVHASVPDGCVTCHMADAFGAQSGGHTWNMAYEYHEAEVENVAGCQSCHNGLDTFDRNGLQTEVEELMEELHGLLVAQGLITESGSVVTQTVPSAQAGAIWNYKTVEEDRSEGVHNPQYTKFLLQTAIDALK